MVIINAEQDPCARIARSAQVQGAGYRCIDASSLDAAIALAKQNAGAVLLIGSLSDASHQQACQAIHELPELATCAAILVYSEGATISETTRAFADGADGYFVEPVLAQNLISTVQSAHRARCAEARWAEENQRLTALLETLFDGYYEVDRQWHIHGANPVTLRHVQRQNRRYAGQTMWELWPEIRGTIFETNYRRVMEERLPLQFEAPSAVEPDRYLQLACYPIPDGMAVYFRDITERARRAQALEQTNARLLRAKEELEQFAYTVSHDLNEPARTVFSVAETIRSRGELAPQVSEDLQQISAAAKRMLDMISGMLSYSVAAEISEPGVIGAEHALRWALANLEAAIQAAGGSVSIAPLPEIRGDFTQISRVFQNLISNSIKYRDPARPLIVTISADVENGFCRFCIADNGLGFDARYAERIFDMFRRLHGREYEGVGIGLATCRRIVERHGGRIWAEGQPGLGSRFYFTLPLAGAAAAAGMR